MDFSETVSFPKIKKWFEDNKDNFKSLGDDIIGYKLNISRPFWFKNHNECDKIESLVFTGKSNEEIFIKMYEKCLKTLVWKGGKNDGKPVDLLDYLQPYNKVFEYMVYKLGDEYAVQQDDSVESDSDEEQDDDSENESEAKSENDEPEFNNYGDIIIEDSNKEKYEPVLIKRLIRDKLDFYGFTDSGMLDCCFYVTELGRV